MWKDILKRPSEQIHTCTPDGLSTILARQAECVHKISGVAATLSPLPPPVAPPPKNRGLDSSEDDANSN
jgi:hypothetical protein